MADDDPGSVPRPGLPEHRGDGHYLPAPAAARPLQGRLRGLRQNTRRETQKPAARVRGPETVQRPHTGTGVRSWSGL